MSDITPNVTEEEVLSIREGIDGIKRPLPARFYHDKDLYEWEVENILKKNWLAVGRWDQIENPGDYFTTKMFGESVVIVRDKKDQVHALYNVCQHRWTQVVDDGAGNANLFTCPYHRWTYNLDGSLRGVAVKPMKDLDKEACAMPKLAIEIWQGFVFVNFDVDAKPLAPQLEAINDLLEQNGVSQYREGVSINYTSTWNWKFSFETGYEGYHHAGVHNERFNHIEPAGGAYPLHFGDICGSYQVPFADDIAAADTRPFGPGPGVKAEDPAETDTFVAIYPSLIMYTNNYQTSFVMLREWNGVDSNEGSTRQIYAPWVNDSPNAKEGLAFLEDFTTEVQKEDSYACTMLQKGVRSKSNGRGVIHPLEPQLNHYHNWYLDQIAKTAK